MEAGIIAAIVIAGLTCLGIGITLIVLLVRGGFLLGRLFTQVEGLGAQVKGLGAQVESLGVQVQILGAQVESLATQVGTLTTAVAGLQIEVQQNGRMLVALSNLTMSTATPCSRYRRQPAGNPGTAPADTTPPLTAGVLLWTPASSPPS